MSNFKLLEKMLESTLKQNGKRYMYLVRHGQSEGNHAGCIVGWTNSKLSIKGRQQANKLFGSLYPSLNKFTSYHSSDLLRCVESLKICTGFSTVQIQQSQKIRELNFADQEGVHYDSLPEEEKKIISSLQYKPKNGETWPQARQRAIKYLNQLDKGHHLIMTHGGLICALTYHLGVTKVVPNCSIVCAELCPEKQEFISKKFIWTFEE